MVVAVCRANRKSPQPEQSVEYPASTYTYLLLFLCTGGEETSALNICYARQERTRLYLHTDRHLKLRN